MPAKVVIPLPELLQLIEQHRGNVSQIGRVVRHSRHTVQARIDESVQAQRALQDAREARIDQAIDALYEEGIDKRNIAALIFILKADPVAKRRGWGERTEVAGPDGGPVKTQEVGRVHGGAEHVAAVIRVLAEAGAVELRPVEPGSDAAADEVHPA